MKTPQRKTLYKVLRASDRPLSRAEILDLARMEMPRLGSATVDRYIKEQTRNFQLVGLSFPGQPTRYELPSEKEHPHFICRVCEKVFDLDIPMRLPKVTLPVGFQQTGGEVVYSGVCPACRGRVRSSRRSF